MTFEQFRNNVESRAEVRGIYEHSTKHAQALKAVSEMGELEVLLLRVQVSLSLDDTEWGYSGAEKYKLLADIRAALSAGNEDAQ